MRKFQYEREKFFRSFYVNDDEDLIKGGGRFDLWALERAMAEARERRKKEEEEEEEQRKKKKWK